MTTLRADPTTRALPLLVIADRLDSSLRADLVEAGADGCLGPEAVGGALLPMATSMVHLARDRALHMAVARESEWLLEVAHELGIRRYPEQALTSVASIIAAAVPLSSCSIIVLSPDASTGYVATGAASLDPFRSGDTPSFELAAYPQMLKVVQQQQRLVLDALPHDPFELTISFDEESLAGGEGHSAALFPILDDAEVVGILALHLPALAPPLDETRIPFFERATALLARPLSELRDRMQRAGERVSHSLDDTDTTLAEHDLLVNMVEHSPNAVVAADMAGNVLVFNRTAEKLFGYASAEVMGHMQADDLMLPGAGFELRQQLTRGEGSDTGHVHDLQLEGLAASGEIIPVSVSAANLMEDGFPVATVRIYQDQ